MNKVLHNRLLVYGILIILSYWTAGAFTPKPYMSSAMSLMTILTGGMLFWRYFTTSYQIVFHGERGDGTGYIAILGASLLSFGIIYSGFFNLIWIYFGRPDEWSSTTASSFGRWMVSIGFFMMAMSPDMITTGAKYPVGLWRTIFVLCGLILAFLAGSQFSSID